MATSTTPPILKSPSAAATAVKQLGRKAGFHLVRIAEATQLVVELDRHLQWIKEGRQGDMAWMTAERAEGASEPGSVLPQAASVICVGLSYWSGQRPQNDGNQGKIARYAWGSDYHSVLGERLGDFAEKLRIKFGGEHKWYVDTGPLMDKALAARSGLGFYGKNTNILTERFGSFVLLGEIVTTLKLQPDPPLLRDCGSCRLCVVACPTGALGPDYSIDSRKCISYLTIEHRSAIPVELRDKIGDWVFGCDICQDVCPPTMEPHLSSKDERVEWIRDVRSYTGKFEDQLNRDDPPSASQPDKRDDASVRNVARVLRPRPRPGLNTVPTRNNHVARVSVPDDFPAATNEDPPTRNAAQNPLFEKRKTPEVDLFWLLRLTHAQYVETFRGTAVRRAKDWMLRRNAAVALGNTGTEEAIGPLKISLESDEHPVVRGHAAWALGKLRERLNVAEAREYLAKALTSEEDPDVRSEIEDALAR